MRVKEMFRILEDQMSYISSYTEGDITTLELGYGRDYSIRKILNNEKEKTVRFLVYSEASLTVYDATYRESDFHEPKQLLIAANGGYHYYLKPLRVGETQ